MAHHDALIGDLFQSQKMSEMLAQQELLIALLPISRAQRLLRSGIHPLAAKTAFDQSLWCRNRVTCLFHRLSSGQIKTHDHRQYQDYNGRIGDHDRQVLAAFENCPQMV